MENNQQLQNDGDTHFRIQRMKWENKIKNYGRKSLKKEEITMDNSGFPFMCLWMSRTYYSIGD